MSHIKRVLIVGGGIGGLCTGIGLAQAGIASEIVEIKTDWSVYGVGIIQPSNQLRALAELGLAQICVERGSAFLGWEFCDDVGNVRARVPNPEVAGLGYPPINGIARPVLHEILTATAEQLGVTVRLGLTVDAIHDRADGVQVRFSDGTTGAYDLMIGADGAYSKMRTLLFGSSHRPMFNGLAVWRYNFPRPPDMEWGSVHYSGRAKAGLVPISPSLMYIFVVTPELNNAKPSSSSLADAMRERLEEFGGPVAALREQIVDPASVVYRPMEPILQPAPWHRGHVLLIGDAAHAATPHLSQGASMAIEDAVLVAQLLSQDRLLGDLFAEFMRRRFERCKFVVDTSSKISRWEVAEFAGRPDPETDHSGTMADAGRVLAQSY
jgi:2-polyprenyl-6-methoxyphenol hydroxylase-like FAD-dependent oxidoreductase